MGESEGGISGGSGEIEWLGKCFGGSDGFGVAAEG